LLSDSGQRLVALRWPDGRQGPVEVSIGDAGAGPVRTIRLDRPTGNGVAIALSPDGRQLALGGSIQEIWDLDGERPLASLQGASTYLINGLAYSPDGNRLAVAESYFKGKAGEFGSGIGRRVFLLNVDTGVQAASLGEDAAAVDHLKFSADAREVHGVGGRRLYCWNADSGKKLRDITLNAPANRPAFSPDCTRLASVSPEGKIILWDVASGQRLLTFPGFESQVTAIAFDRNASRLAVAGSEGANGIVRIYDATPLE
jgi:WD40 repeat protein